MEHFDHVALIVTAPDGEIEVHYSRHHVDLDAVPNGIWDYHVAAIAAAYPGHSLLAIAEDAEHTHPHVLTSTGWQNRTRHMP